MNDGGNTITGGSAGITGDYTNLSFLWTSSNGQTYNTQDIFDLEPGDYTLTVTDTLCDSLFAQSAVIRIEDSADFTIIPSNGNSTISNCSDGSLQVSIVGGSGNFDYRWTDQNGVVRGTGNRIENLAAGIYDIIVTDNNTGCQQQLSIPISGSTGPLAMVNPIAVNQADFDTADIIVVENLVENLR